MGERDETLAVVVARLDDLRGDFAQLRDELQKRDERYVTRPEWDMWREAVTAQQSAARRRVEDIRQAIADEAQARHVPWTGVAAVVLAAAALAWSVFGPPV